MNLPTLRNFALFRAVGLENVVARRFRSAVGIRVSRVGVEFCIRSIRETSVTHLREMKRAKTRADTRPRRAQTFPLTVAFIAFIRPTGLVAGVRFKARAILCAANESAKEGEGKSKVLTARRRSNRSILLANQSAALLLNLFSVAEAPSRIKFDGARAKVSRRR